MSRKKMGKKWGRIPSSNFTHLRLKYCIFKENAKNKVTGRNASLPIFTNGVKKTPSYDK
jgi:hypothetical protein